MRRWMCAVLLCCLSFAVSAATDVGALSASGWAQLTEVQRTDVLKTVAAQAEKNEKNVAPPVPASAAVEEWVSVGERVGKLLSGTARELGVAVNDFVKTPVGTLVMAMVLWKYLGAAAVHIAAGLFIWGVGLSLSWWVARRGCKLQITYHAEKRTWLGRPLKSSVTRAPMDKEALATFYWSSLFVWLVGLATMFSY